ncbi:hypothetical protein Avbf_06245 [Armadillidium vulgare]|nr:hypothetical protein Avbf_06245 [Armadillidium vulgare]
MLIFVIFPSCADFVVLNIVFGLSSKIPYTTNPFFYYFTTGDIPIFGMQSSISFSLKALNTTEAVPCEFHIQLGSLVEYSGPKGASFYFPFSQTSLRRYNEDNMPIDFRFIDLQCSKKASPATDLNYFFFTSLNGELRMTKRDIMTKIYYDSFREVLEKSGKALPFSFQHTEYDKSLPIHKEIQEKLSEKDFFRDRLLAVFDDMIENNVFD